MPQNSWKNFAKSFPKLLGAVLGLVGFWAGAVFAQTVADCDWRARADAIVEPWQANTRSYANGDVRVALLDAIEPAAGALHLLVISPPRDELGARQCRVVSLDGSMGFAGMLFEDGAASYDPAQGLLLSYDVQRLAGDGGFVPDVLSVVINQATGAITPALASDN